MRVRLTHVDGKLPNLALMKLAHFHRARGDAVCFSRNVTPDLFESSYDRVYASVIFTRSRPLVDRLQRAFPAAIVGGTGLGDDWRTVEQYLGVEEYEGLDYSIYPEFDASIGFTMRGCRLACAFCVVPKKEGRPKSASTLAEIYRGAPYPRHVMLLDNDFFGQPRERWEARLAEIRDGGFRVSVIQGINVRLIDAEVARALADAPLYDDSFAHRRIYTAWDNLKDGDIFVRGVEHLTAAGVRPDNIMAYMLVGYDPAETWARIFERLDVMRALGVRPYPMVYQSFGESRAANGLDFKELKAFQRWVIRRHYHLITFEEYKAQPDAARRLLHMQGEPSLFEAVA